MDLADLQRYTKIATRKGVHFEVPPEEISKLEVSMAPWGV
jgi:hypothetical protein